MEWRRTKIVCTIGPASHSPETIGALIEAGMNVARLNFSHGSPQEHAGFITRLKTVSNRLGARVTILQDLSGPKMRIGKLAEEPVELAPNSQFVLTTRQVLGDQTAVSINYPTLVEALKPGDRILLADGELELRVRAKTETDVHCEVIVGGELKSHKGINAPGVVLTTPVPTQKDIADLIFGIQHGVDWVTQSFVRNADELRVLRTIIRQNGSDVPIIAKIEKREALDDLDGLIAEAD
ncbi:pyruvate kinase, partial [Candidatus Poribacteria bacterium]|nr:pyruvate kinase [Candidatus Poribacteria bacterium]